MVCRDRKMLKSITLAALLLILLSCQTSPKNIGEVLETGFLPLDNDAVIYIYADVQNALPIMEIFSIIPMNDKQFVKILDKTQSAVIAVFQPNAVKNLQLAAWGKFPSTGAKMAMGSNKNWKKMRTTEGDIYWHSAADKLSVALDSRQANVLSINANAAADAPTEPFFKAPGINVPIGFDTKGAAVACWLAEPGAYINNKINEMGLPLEIPAEQLFISLYPAAGQKYRMNIALILPSASQARGIASMLNIARGFYKPDESNSMSSFLDILLSNHSVAEGSSINISVNNMEVNEIALLFKLFSL